MISHISLSAKSFIWFHQTMFLECYNKKKRDLLKLSLESYNKKSNCKYPKIITFILQIEDLTLLNLLNELGKRDKMRGLPSILSLFRNEFNKFNNTRA